MANYLRQTIHLRLNGRSQELAPDLLHLQRDATDEQIKQAVVTYLDLPIYTLRDHVIIRNNQAIIIRPEAVYG